MEMTNPFIVFWSYQIMHILHRGITLLSQIRFKLIKISKILSEWKVFIKAQNDRSKLELLTGVEQENIPQYCT